MKRRISVLIILSIIIAALFSGCTGTMQKKYDTAMALMTEGKYEEAADAFNEIKDFSDSAEKAKECKYNVAVKLQEDGSLERAIEIYTELGEYKDAVARMAECNTAIKMKNLKVGDSINMGRCEQDNYTFNGTESIEWRVLAIEDGKALVISDKILMMASYSGNTWESSSLRSQLNSSFYNDAFTDAEKEKIVLSTLKNEDNPKYGTKGGNDTEDRIFVLSYSELMKYMPDAKDRMAEDTKLVAESGAKKNYEGYIEGGVETSGRYWVRTPGAFVNCAMITYANGNIVMTGVLDFAYWMAARPAMWIDIQ